jgi:hypothetical protein
MRGLLKSLGIIIGKADSRTSPSKIVATLRDASRMRPLIVLQGHTSPRHPVKNAA